MFRTELHITPSGSKISLQSPVISIGSCFSNCTGLKLTENKFDTLTNPFGVIYNPLSIFKLLGYAIDNRLPDKSTYLENQDVFRNYDFHSDFSAIEQASLEDKIAQSITRTSGFLQNAEWLILTPGTAFVYQLKETGNIVANCHKVPSGNFEKRLLGPEEITASFDNLYDRLNNLNKKLKLIFTVSPVRHIKDTLELNALSKSVLRVACGRLAEKYDDVDYFPSYEIMMDDLRDYRFYKADMLHPTEVAEDYIWNKFSKTYFDQETLEFVEKWHKILKAMRHRPFHPNTPAYQQFVQKTIRELNDLSNKVDVTKEIESLKKNLE